MAFTGWAFGLGYFGLSLHWITQPFLVDVARHGWMAPFALLFMAGGMALFWALAFAVAAVLQRRAGGTFALVVCWAGAEVLRSLILTGFPWALLGHVWIDTPVAQLAAFVGPHGLTIVTLAVAAVLARWRLWSLAAPILIAALWWGLDPGPAPAPDPAAPLIRLVQPNVAQADKWNPDLIPLHFQSLLDLTTTTPTAARPPAALVIWPETAIPWLLEQAPGALQAAAQAGRGAAVILGVQRRVDSRYYNALAVLDPAGAVTAVYDKAHLVPFGEYIPLGDVLAAVGLTGFAPGQGDGFSAGPGPAVIAVPGIGLIAPLICYEGIFAEEVNAGPIRPRLIVLITNDAWFGTLAGPYQHFAQARLRAIEQGLPLARVANTGISGLIDARGRVLGQIGLGEQGTLDLGLPAALPPTLYVRVGDAPVLVLLALLCAGLFWRNRRFPIDPAAKPA